VFILKGVKVLCFDTLLQVLILKGFRAARPSWFEVDALLATRVFSKKSLDYAEYKGVGFFGRTKEAATD
jgi:hypothetical protein